MTLAPESPKPKKKPIPVWAWVAAVALLAAIVGAAFWFSGASGEVAVPDVTHGDQYTATKVLEAVSLRLGEVSRQETSAPVGTVVGQNPAGGAQVAKDSAVDIVLSAGPATVVVPELIGLTHSGAVKLLAAAGLESTESAEYDSLVPDGSVIDQLPAQGEKVAPASTVGLLVSLGKRPTTAVKIPDLGGQTRGEAQSTLRDVGLVAYFVSASDAKVLAGSVVEQTPVAGQKVSPGSVILVLISAGAPPPAGVGVPDVVGLQRDAAGAALEKLGLKSQAVPKYDAKPKGEVIAQEPGSGAKVALGSTIGLLVSAGPAPTKPPVVPPTYPDPPAGDEGMPQYPNVDTVDVPNLLSLTEADAVAAVLEAGLQPVPVPSPSDAYEKGIVVKQLPEAKETVFRGYSVMFFVSTGQAHGAPSEEATSPK